MDIRDFKWPSRQEMGAQDRNLWLDLVLLIREYVEVNSRSVSTAGQVGLPSSGYLRSSGRTCSPAYLRWAGKSHGRYGLGTAWAQFIGFPSFMKPIENAYIIALNKFFPETNGEGEPLANPPAWIPAVCMFPLLNDEAALEKFVQQLPHISTQEPDKLAFWPTPQKMLSAPQKIKPAAYAKRQLKPNATEAELAAITFRHRQFLGSVSDLVGFVENDDKEGWSEVYDSGRIASCMKSRDEVRCYAAASFGLPNNGLRLAYLKGSSPERVEAVARCIVHEPTKTYIRIYGDDTMQVALESLGYTHAGAFPGGTLLATWETDDDCWATPYIDGATSSADLIEVDGVPAWRLSQSGDYDLQTTTGHVSLYEGEPCPCCDESVDITHTIVMQGAPQEVCESCWESAIGAYYAGDYIRTTDATITVYDRYDDNDEYLDTPGNLAYYDIRWSAHEGGYIIGDDVIELALNEGYAFETSKGVVELSYSSQPEYWALSRDTCEFEGYTVLDDDCITWTYDGVDYMVPTYGLSTALNNAIDEFKRAVKASRAEEKAS